MPRKRKPLITAGGKTEIIESAEHKKVESLYKSIFELSPDSIVTLDNKGFITSINSAGAKIVGYSQKELIGKHFAKTGYLHFRDIPKYIRLYNSAIKGKEIKPFEIELVRKDGTYIIAEIRIGLLKENGKIIGIQAVTRDITERKKAEELMKESEEKWRSFAENAPNIITISDRGGKILFINHIKHAVPGYSKKDVIGTKVYEYVPKELHSIVRKNIEYVFKTGRTSSYETKGQAPGGNISWYVTHVGPVMREGKVIAATLISTDITERKKAEEELQERERKLKILFDILPVGVSILNAERKIIYINPALGRILGVSMEGLLRGDHKSRMYLRTDGTPMPAEEFASVRAVKEQRAVNNVETGVLKEDGSIVWTDVSAVPVKFLDWNMVITTSDITERKKAEQELIKSERFKLLGTLVSGIAHEVRNPLVSIKGFFQMINEMKEGDPERQELANIATDEILRIEGLLDSILGFAKPIPNNYTKFKLGDAINFSIILIKHEAGEKGIKISTFNEYDKEIFADRKQIHQVLLNIILNAIEAMRAKGKLKITVRSNDGADKYVIEFKDDGCGMDNEVLSKAFTPFFTTKENGTGLGLSLSQKIISEHGGNINIKSKKGKGTCVSVSLPKAK